MDWFNLSIRFACETFVSLFGELHPLVSLTVLSILIGIAMLWVFGKTSNQQGIERTKKKMQAYLLELRLYGDDPGPLFRAQRDLIVSNMKYMGLMFKPALYLTIPMVVLLFHFDAIYGIRAIPIGQSAIVTVQAAGRLTNRTAVPKLAAPAGIKVETPGVRALDVGQFSWRIRAESETIGELQFEWEGRTWTKEVAAGDKVRYISHTRESSAFDSIAAPGESLLDVDQITSVAINYPAAEIETGSLRLHWLVWFLVISIVAAYLLKDLFGIKI